VVKQNGWPAGSNNTRQRSGAGWLAALRAPRRSASASAASRLDVALGCCLNRCVPRPIWDLDYDFGADFSGSSSRNMTVLSQEIGRVGVRRKPIP